MDGAAENVTKGTKNLQKASWLKVCLFYSMCESVCVIFKL